MPGSDPPEGGAVTADLRPFAVDLADPLDTAAGTIEHRRGVLVRVEGEGDGRSGSGDEGGADSGDGGDGCDTAAVGLGETTPLPGWTESFEAAREALADAVQVLRERSAAEALELLRGAPAARHGLHLALADLAARQAGDSLAAHLAAADGAAVADSVPLNATVGVASPDETAAAAAEAVESGFDCVKVKVGARDAAMDTGRLAAVRDAVGPDAELRADANGAWTRAQAYEAVRNYPTAGVDVVEQPLSPTDLRGNVSLREGSVDVALDETVAGSGVEAVLDAGAADVVVLKPMALGGVDRAREAAMAALDAGVDVVVSNTIDPVVARTAAGHLAASLPSLRACGLATADRLAADLAPDPAPVADGRMGVPDGPGTGVDVAAAWDAAAESEVSGGA